jgi:DNA-binding GntR family transcriptional regulator
MVSMVTQRQSDLTKMGRRFASLASRTSVAEAAYRALRLAIVTMELPPGTRLTEQELATVLQISRQPVREALLRLRDADFVDVRGQRGSFVARISTAAVQSAQFVREAVEVAIVSRAAEGLDAHERDPLQFIIQRQEKAFADKNPEAFFFLDEEFHFGLASAVGCSRAWKIIEDVKGHMDRVRFLSLPDATPLDRLIAQHQAILDAIVRRDPDAAARAMQVHLREIVVSLPPLADQHPDLFALKDEGIAGSLGERASWVPGLARL